MKCQGNEGEKNNELDLIKNCFVLEGCLKSFSLFCKLGCKGHNIYELMVKKRIKVSDRIKSWWNNAVLKMYKLNLEIGNCSKIYILLGLKTSWRILLRF